VITGAGKAFSAGADINEFAEADAASIAAYYADHRRCLRANRRAADADGRRHPRLVSGRRTGDGARYRLPHRGRDGRFGLPKWSSAFSRAPEEPIGSFASSVPARAKELMLLRRRFDASEGPCIRLVTDVVAAGQALERALEVAAELAVLPPLAVETTKRAADLMPESSREAGMLIERLAYAALAQTDEAKKAVDDFTVEVRRP
jgi:enoyl-CoA hydratase